MSIHNSTVNTRTSANETTGKSAAAMKIATTMLRATIVLGCVLPLTSGPVRPDAPTNKRLILEVQKVKCGDETGPWWRRAGGDEIAMTAVAIDARAR
jgi:hypothetical protein